MSDKYPGGFVTAGAPAGFSVALNGSSDYLTVPDNAVWDLSGDFTLELWAYLNNFTSTGASPTFISGTNSSNNWLLFVTSSNEVIFLFNTGTVINGTATSTPNEWAHYALTRSGSTVRIFKNGVLLTSATNSTNFTIANSVLYLGVQNGSNGFINGYMSNVRLVNGTALYTANFTPPTQLFPVPNTVFLACQSPTIIDNSTNNFAITAVSGAKVSNFTPFAAYQGFNPALGAAAGGVWTLDEAAYYQNNRQWPIYDPYFNQTTLMLHGNGTNGAQNNTFLDSSTNNSTITRAGNATQGSFSPFSQTGSSTYFNGSSQGIVIPSSTFSGSWVNSNFTFETWVYVVGDGPNGFAWFYGQNNNDCLYLGLDITNRNIYYGSFNGISFNYSYTTSNNIWQKNRWMHIAWVRNSTASNTGGMKIFLNGVMVGQGNTGTFGVFDNSFFFNNAYNPWADFNGYCAGLRLTNRALYSSNFTPERLTNVAGTKVLLCTDKTITDASSNRYPLSITGSPSVQAFSPFAPAYITPTTYSNWFDGSGDYLTAPNAAWMNLGTGDFTMECWVQFNSVSSTQMFVSNNYNAGTGGGGWAFLYRQDNTTLKFSCNSNVSYEKTWSPAAGTMYHVAVCRSGTNLRLFVDGAQLGTTSTSSDNISGASSTLVVGSNLGGTPLPINGVISNMRIVTSALYTASFTPPTAPLTAITNTQLLTCQSSTFVDNSVNAATFTAYGNVQPVTSPTPFPAKVDTTTLNSAYSTSLIGGSYYGDGSGDYVYNNSTNLQIASSTNFTFECWLYRQSTFTGDQGTCFFAIGSESANRIQFTMFGSQIRVEVYAGTLDFYGGFVPLNAWTHVAIVRTGGSTISIYINGVFATSASYSSVIGNSGGFIIGANRSVSNYVNGNISGLRLINGTALYTSNFAPPTLPPTAITNTTLLTNFTNGGIFDNTAKNVLETIGNAQISTTQSKWGGSSMYFDGTGDRVHISPNTSQNVVLGTGDFTIEMWIYPTATSASTINLFSGDTNSAYLAWATSGLWFGTYNVNWILQSSVSPALNTWSHIAVTRLGTTTNLFVNGVAAVASTSSSQNFSAASYVIGGDQVGGTVSLTGYIDDLRVTKGVARYITNFTPPTSQLQDQ